MRVKSVQGQGILSFQQPFEVAFTPGLYYLQGENRLDKNTSWNMAGKTNFMDVILWLLFKTTSKGIKANNVKNWYSKTSNNCLRFNEAGIECEIQRYINDPTYGNMAKFFANGDDLTPRIKDNLDSFVKTIVGMSFQSFMHTMIFGGIFTKLFTTLRGSERKEILEDILELSILDTAREIARIKVKDMDSILTEMDSTLNVYTRQIDTNEMWLNNVAAFKNKSYSSDTEASLTRVRNDLSVINKALIDESINNLSSKATSLVQERAEKRILQLPGVGEQCPVCDTIITQKMVDKSKAKNKDINERITVINEELNLIQSDVMELRQQVNTYHGKKSQEQTLEQSLQESKEFKKQEAEFNKRADEINKETQNLKHLLQILKDKRNELDNKSQAYRFWVKGYSKDELRHEIITSNLNFINQRIAYYLALASPDKTVELRGYRTNQKGDKSEDLDFYVEKEGVKVTKYEEFSSGEKARIDMPIFFAIRDFITYICNRDFNLLFIDELNYIDDCGKIEILKILRSMTFLNLCIYFTNTGDILPKDLSDGIVRIVKDQQGSHIINE